VRGFEPPPPPPFSPTHSYRLERFPWACSNLCDHVSVQHSIPSVCLSCEGIPAESEEVPGETGVGALLGLAQLQHSCGHSHGPKEDRIEDLHGWKPGVRLLNPPVPNLFENPSSPVYCVLSRLAKESCTAMTLYHMQGADDNEA